MVLTKSVSSRLALQVSRWGLAALRSKALKPTVYARRIKITPSRRGSSHPMASIKH
ncbi:hypothetical protein FHU41_000964 [Psychromicrobium silvestre]|uniref:Uncharacterized protein n=1 Tax=Psychromicrobium silvestre TaxID=1645614 RepID=A0A7Y9S562_9MICC|nr:hypothetical protein [Psychromicrobium silvestre]